VQAHAADSEGLSTLCSGPATKPSSDIEIFRRSLDMSLASGMDDIPSVACRGFHYNAFTNKGFGSEFSKRMRE
jgi:hypothetical protein